MPSYQLPIVRVLEAIRRIGYTPVSAILDIVDNSIVAEASEIKIIINTKPHPTKKLRQIISDIYICDNGKGMSPSQMTNALILGSPESSYDKNSLSKFGFGLKSAGLSQANRIEVISRNNRNDEWVKYVLDWDSIVDKNEYYILENERIEEVEFNLLKSIGDTGTIVILKKILQVNDASPSKMIKNVIEECGITYHRIIEKKGIIIKVNGELVEPYDPLFLSEASKSVNEYDGTTVCSYFVEPFELPIKTDSHTTMTLNAVQLPYPPMFKNEGRQKEINKKYRMQLKNIGFYIYRNDRLIAKGEKLGLVPSDQDYMSFRASIDFDSSADNDINLDVTKTKVIFPDYAFEALKERMNGIIKNSATLWNLIKIKSNNPNVGESEKTHERSNELLKNSKPIIVDLDKGETKPMENFVEQKKTELKEIYETTPDLIELLKGKRKRIIPVDDLPNVLLWKPGIDFDNNCEVVVYLSKSHPFYEYIYKKLEAGDDALVILDALFLNLAMAETSILAINKEHQKMFEQLRTTASYQLSKFIEVALENAE